MTLDMHDWQEVRCPGCGRLLCKAYEATGHHVRLVIEIKCTCRRLIHINEDFIAEVVSTSE